MFPINKFDEDKCITKLFNDKNDKAKITSFIYEGILMKRTKLEAVLFCKTSLTLRLDGDFDPTDEMDKCIKACCLHFKNNNYGIYINSEASFIKKHLLPFVDEMFLKSPDKNIICVMMDGAEQNGRMPDLKLGYKFKGKPHFAFFVEVKRPGQTSHYQDEIDFVKLLKAMKKPASFGLLVEGFKCILYMMKIHEEGVYIPAVVRKFVLIEGIENAVNIPAVVESFFFVKEKLDVFFRNFKTR
ncbi:hypothetical protein CU097_008633 [Rhizopus azygosporus]|uniref:Uncharacterized protein n=1 Tax=Rhizopus azygosporus TaxID=86630 RepID=A0A367K9Y2_RHIAZ|nr:hypothetical protein CU097_008633 [Rhizopus azygosporus]